MIWIDAAYGRKTYGQGSGPPGLRGDGRRRSPSGGPGAAAVSLGRLSGSHAVTLNLASLDLSAATLTDAMTLFYRVEGSSIGGQTLFGTGGIASQRFTLSAELGPLNVQGGASFSSKAFAFGNLVLSGRFEGVALMVAGLTSNVGSVQTPVYGFGTTVRVSGFVPNLGRLAFVFGIGATPFGQVKPGFCFEGACISWADLGFCGGDGERRRRVRRARAERRVPRLDAADSLLRFPVPRRGLLRGPARLPGVPRRGRRRLGRRRSVRRLVVRRRPPLRERKLAGERPGVGRDPRGPGYVRRDGPPGSHGLVDVLRRRALPHSLLDIMPLGPVRSSSIRRASASTSTGTSRAARASPSDRSPSASP